MLKLLDDLKSENLISELNYQFAKMIDKQQQAYHYEETIANLAVFLSALVSFNVMQGHSCVNLIAFRYENVFGLSSYKNSNRNFVQEIRQKVGDIPAIEWQQKLAEHIAFSQTPSQVAPMLFQHQQLYFYRYWQAENRIADYLKQAVNSAQKLTNPQLTQQILSSFFSQKSDQIDWQKVAVATALKQKFCLISGGPGTGKTRTVAILLAALQRKQLEQGDPLLQIALVAPTGKAAARLKESITQNLLELKLPEALESAVPTQASTIHSLVGIHPNSDTPRYHQQNPLHIDLIVVDEASMIDLFVMEKLLNALKPTTRLIMLGDKDQLASVEAGNMMNELGKLISYGYSHAHSEYLSATTGYILNAQTNPPAICDSLCYLRHSYRFNEKSGIGQLAAQVNAQQAVKSWQLFANTQFRDLKLWEYPNVMDFADKAEWTHYCVDSVVKKAVELYRDYLMQVKARIADPQSVSVKSIFERFQQVRFLSALRVSELGVERLNQRIAEALQNAKLVQFHHSRENYFGKPIMINENAPQLNVFSGDIGIILPDEQGKPRAYFETEINGKALNLSPTRLPSNEPAYIMTVHKSQGSEFSHTLLVMPLNISPVVTKELIYTAITRAKEQFSLFSNEKVWKQGVKAMVQRQSGLMEQILSDENGVSQL